MKRRKVSDVSGFNRDPNSVIPQAQTVPDEMAGGFLEALGFDPQLMEPISAEVARVLPL